MLEVRGRAAAHLVDQVLGERDGSKLLSFCRQAEVGIFAVYWARVALRDVDGAVAFGEIHHPSVR